MATWLLGPGSQMGSDCVVYVNASFYLHGRVNFITAVDVISTNNSRRERVYGIIIVTKESKEACIDADND
jgi:hypothetical protein